MERIKGLDGLRALAIILVIIHHTTFVDVDSVPFGIMYFLSKYSASGVDLFFVLSGFLITTLLIRNKGKKNYFKAFYMRRVLRIFPLYFSILLFAFIILPATSLKLPSDWSGVEPLWYWVFLSNYYIGLKASFSHGLVDLSWSLSIEEQFYFLWPALIAFISIKKLKIFFPFFVIVPIILRIWHYEIGTHPIGIHTFTHTRIDTIIWGCLLAFSWDSARLLPRKYSLGFMWILILLLYVLNSLINYELKSIFNYTLFALAYLALLHFTLFSQASHLWLKLMESKTMIFIGKVSFGIYLLHNPIQAVLKKTFLNFTISSSIYLQYINQLFFYIVVLALSSFAAWISFKFLEAPFLKYKKNFPYD